MPDIIANQNQNNAKQNIHISNGIHCTYSAFYLLMIASWQIWFPFHEIDVQLMGLCRMSYEIVLFIYTKKLESTWINKELILWLQQNKAEPTVYIFYGMYSVCRIDPIHDFSQWGYHPTIIAWATILKSNQPNLCKSFEIRTSEDEQAMFVKGPSLLNEISEAIIEVWTWISCHIA